MVMHRIATSSAYRGKGYGNALFLLFEDVVRKEGYPSPRVDTYENNKVMRHLLDRNGFVQRGKAILTPNKGRLLFKKVLQD